MKAQAICAFCDQPILEKRWNEIAVLETSQRRGEIKDNWVVCRSCFEVLNGSLYELLQAKLSEK